MAALGAPEEQAGSLEPPPGPVSPTRPEDRCFDNSGNRFVDCQNGTIKDTQTGLIWLKNANCFFENWADANIRPAELGHGQCGLTDGSLPGDWRLPTLGCPSGYCNPISAATGERATLFGPACSTPPYVLNTAGTGCWTEGDPFSEVQPNVWSSSTNAAEPDIAWCAIVELNVVQSLGKYGARTAWPVRGGQ